MGTSLDITLAKCWLQSEMNCVSLHNNGAKESRKILYDAYCRQNESDGITKGAILKKMGGTYVVLSHRPVGIARDGECFIGIKRVEHGDTSEFGMRVIPNSFERVSLSFVKKWRV